MQFTEEDISLMKLIFNPETHAMGMMIGRERAEEIFEYVCLVINRNRQNLMEYTSDFYEAILFNATDFHNFFWDNNILRLSFLDSIEVYCILAFSPIAKKIWDSGKLDLSLLDEDELEYFKQKFDK